MSTHAAVGRQIKTAKLKHRHAHTLEQDNQTRKLECTLFLQSESKPLLVDSLFNRGATVACLQETRFPGYNACVIQDSNDVPSYRFFVSDEEKCGLHGVGIAIQLRLAKRVMSWRPFAAHLCHLRLSAKPLPISPVYTYSPTKDTDTFVKETFQMHLNNLLDSIPKKTSCF